MRFSVARPQEVGGHGEGSRQEITEESARKWSSKLNEQKKKNCIYSLSNSNVPFHELLALLVIIAFFFFLVFYAHWEVITNQFSLFSHRLQFFYSPPQQRIQGGLSFGNKAAGESRRRRKRALAKQKVTSKGSEVTPDNGRGVGGNFRPQA